MRTLSCTFLSSILLFSVLPALQAQTDSLRVLALGDSYTIGEGVAKSERWPVTLVRKLNARGFPVKQPEILALTGWTTGELRSAVDEASQGGYLSPPYDLVTLLIGVNDQYRGHPIEEYEDGFNRLLDKALHLAGGDADCVLVLSIPDYGVTPFARERNPEKISRAINLYNRINKTIAKHKKVLYANVTPVSRMAGGDLSLLAEDKLHPSGKMYEKWVDVVLPLLIPKLTLQE